MNNNGTVKKFKLFSTKIVGNTSTGRCMSKLRGSKAGKPRS